MKPIVVAVLAAGLAAQSAPAWRAAQVASFDLAWQTINETFYDPSFGGVDWEGVRDELRPRVAAAPTRDEARRLIREMLGRLGRSHIALMSEPPASAPAGGPAVVPFAFRVTGREVLVVESGDPDAVVHPGDVLMAIGDQPVAGLIEAAEGGNDRARALDAWRRVDTALRGADGSRVAVDLRRGAEVLHGLEVTRRRPAGQPVRFGNLPELQVEVDTKDVRTPNGRRIGVIAFNVWLPAINTPVAQAVDRFRAYDGLVIDLRGNPGGVAEMIRGVAGHLIDEPVVLGRMRMREARLEFPVNPRRATDDGRTVEPFAGPVAILVDGMTASTSECFAGALQDLGRARIFGRQTAGMALPALTRRLPSGDILMYAIGDFETSTGRALEGDGVVPDQAVVLAPQELAAGLDPDLAAALRWFDRF